MARIAGVDLPREKRVEVGLTYVYGIGHSSAVRILKEAGVDLDTRVRVLSMTSRILATSSSVRSLTLVSRSTPASFRIRTALEWPMP